MIRIEAVATERLLVCEIAESELGGIGFDGYCAGVEIEGEGVCCCGGLGVEAGESAGEDARWQPLLDLR